VKFERLLETYLSFAPRGRRSFVVALPVWLKEKLFLKAMLSKDLAALAGVKKSALPPILFTEHHEAHAASAFFPSPFRTAAVLCMDGVGEWATTSAWLGQDNHLTPLWDIPFPHSLGLLYSAFTYYTGFKVNSGEYKVMGLAPYGQPKYVQTIYDHLLDLKPDGTFRLNMDYFNYCTGLTMTNERFHALFGAPPRPPESLLRQEDMDLARSIQDVTEEVMVRLARTMHRETGADHLCLAGGVALNCVGNGKILREGPFKGLWIQPAAGDAGGALGAALFGWHQYLGKERRADGRKDSQHGSYLGPEFSPDEIRRFLTEQKAPFVELSEKEIPEKIADLIKAGKVIGWFQGRMEFGPRALGARSIIGDAQSPKMQEVMNLKIKFRESFRPFAPTVLRERVSEYFELDCDSPYMLLVAPVAKTQRRELTPEEQQRFGLEKLLTVRSTIPAVTHVDHSARVQTVTEEQHPLFYRLIKKFADKHGCPVIINTSFNVRGEPIVCTPEQAFLCFMRTNMDYLLLGNFLVEKTEQKPLDKDIDWLKEFELD